MYSHLYWQRLGGISESIKYSTADTQAAAILKVKEEANTNLEKK